MHWISTKTYINHHPDHHVNISFGVATSSPCKTFHFLIKSHELILFEDKLMGHIFKDHSFDIESELSYLLALPAHYDTSR